MKKSLRRNRYGTVLAGLLTLAALIVFLGPLLIPAATLKRELVSWVRAKTGLTLTIQGPVEVTIFPTLGLSLDRVTLMNPKGFSPKPLIRIHHASIQAAFLPLFAGTIRVSKTTLQGVHLALLTNRAGVSNVAQLIRAIAGPKPYARPATR
ncbi:secreted protein containing AsmA domain protein, partial [mine drainage metagenome]